jgi:hypothetical protein
MKSLQQLVRDFGAARRAYHTLAEQEPRIVKDIAIKETQRNFHMQGDVSDDYHPWEARKESTNKSYDARGKNYKGSVYSSSRPLLKQTGNTYNAIGNDSYETHNMVYIGVNLNQFPGDYPKWLNEGTEKMVARPWIKFGKRMRDRVVTEFQRRRNVIFNKFRW